MPDETQDINAELTAAQEEAARERREKQNIIETLRKRDARTRQQDDTIAALQARLDRIETERQEQQNGAVHTAPRGTITADDPEPDIDTEPTKWFKWRDLRDERRRQQEAQQNDIKSLNTFAVTSEQSAREKEPHYDEARDFFRNHYRGELEASGELEEAALRVLAQAASDKTGFTRQQVNARMAEKGLSELDAAKDWCFEAAFEARRMDTVRAQLRRGGNPALQLVEMAKQRGWKPGTQFPGARLAPADKNDKGSTSALVDDSMKELERRRNLRAATQTTADVRDGGEVPEKQVYNRAQLEELQRTNPAEYKRAIAQIVADAESDPSAHHGIITR